MPTHVSARYRARDGTNHRVIARRTADSRWRVLDVTAGSTLIVETLADRDDQLAQARRSRATTPPSSRPSSSACARTRCWGAASRERSGDARPDDGGAEQRGRYGRPGPQSRG